MTPQQYKPIHDWFTARPAALALLLAADRGLPLISAALYGVLLAGLGMQVYQGEAHLMPLLARAVLVPAAVLGIGSGLRRALNRPRPYEQPGFVPLRSKSTRGQSFPSRHALSSAVIAAAWLRVSPAVGWGLWVLTAVLCACRVLTGVHRVPDVLAGAALGFSLGVLGMWI